MIRFENYIFGSIKITLYHYGKDINGFIFGKNII